MKNKVTIVAVVLLIVFAISRIDFRSTEAYYNQDSLNNSQLNSSDEDNQNTSLDGILQNSDGNDDKYGNSKSKKKNSNSDSSPDNNIKVTIYIDVTNLQKEESYAKLKPELKKYVPSSGYILDRTTITVKKNSTSFDVLQKATRLNKIHMEYQGANENIYNSVYVQGINHLYEFSAGSESGWMYSVNSIFPNYGMSAYTVSDGDLIRMVYTVDLGCDVGYSMKKCN